jgi:hypothetical protein
LYIMNSVSVGSDGCSMAVNLLQRKRCLNARILKGRAARMAFFRNVQRGSIRDRWYS